MLPCQPVPPKSRPQNNIGCLSCKPQACLGSSGSSVCIREEGARGRKPLQDEVMPVQSSAWRGHLDYDGQCWAHVAPAATPLAISFIILPPTSRLLLREAQEEGGTMTRDQLFTNGSVRLYQEQNNLLPHSWYRIQEKESLLFSSHKHNSWAHYCYSEHQSHGCAMWIRKGRGRSREPMQCCRDTFHLCTLGWRWRKCVARILAIIWWEAQSIKKNHFITVSAAWFYPNLVGRHESGL